MCSIVNCRNYEYCTACDISMCYGMDLSMYSNVSVAVACGARLSCSVVMVYSVLLSMSLVAHAPI